MLRMRRINKQARKIIITKAKDPERSEIHANTSIIKCANKLCKVTYAYTNKFIDTV